MLDQRSVDLVCLAGFMRLFTAEFVQRWHGRMLNIHPSLLPSFPGLDPHGQALKAGVKISGATVHFVTPDTDAGPIVIQGAVAVKDDDTAETLSERILAVEHQIYPAAVRLVADMRVRIDGERCVIEGAVSDRRDHDRAERLKHQPTISLPEKNCAISIAAVSGASEPCTEFSPIDFACTLRMVPSAAFDGSVAPITSR